MTQIPRRLISRLSSSLKISSCNVLAPPTASRPSQLLVSVRTLSTEQPERSSAHNLIGQPDVVSNISPIKFKDTDDPLELELQQVQKELLKFNHEFWHKHNREFQHEKKLFVTKNNLQGATKVNSEEMSLFYKEFLDRKYHEHRKYNGDWLRLISKLTLISLKVRLKQTINNGHKRFKKFD